MTSEGPLGDGASKYLWHLHLGSEEGEEEGEDSTAFSCWRHPFVRRLLDGTLPRRVFRFYVAQDFHFLTAFSEAYLLASIYASAAGDNAASDELEELRESVTEELQLHRRYAESWGVDLEDGESLPPPSQATSDYTSFLLETAESTSSPARVLAAMAPCCRLYGWLGVKLSRARAEKQEERDGDGEHPYRAWIETYSSEEYHGATRKLEALLDRLAEPMTEGERASLIPLFSRAMRLEHAFFTAALAQGNEGTESDRPLPSLLVVDFDETLTRRDTTRLVIGAAAEAASARGDVEGRKRAEETTARLVRRYAEEREALFRGELPEALVSSSSTSKPFDPAATASFLSKLSAFDREANARAFDSGILAGIRKGDLYELGRRKESGGEGEGERLLRPGAARALSEARSLGVPTRVLSVSWSSELIRGALSAALEDVEVSCDDSAWGLDGKGGGGKTSSAAVAVAANDLDYDSSSVSNGSVIRKCECADDKLSLFSELVGSLPPPSGRGPVVFVGDSPSDLGALLAADVGIVIAGSKAPSDAPSELRRVAGALGVRVSPLSEAASALEGGEKDEKEATLFEARSWDEVSSLLFPRSPPPLSPAEPRPAIPRVLTIAGSDSGGGAGVQADVKAASALGVFSSTAITAVTVQNSRGVSGFHRVPPAVVREQAEAVLSDIGADAVKTGMIPDAESVEAVASVVEAWRKSGGGSGGNGGGGIDHARYPLVVDPVLVSTSGDALAEGSVARALAERLFPLATVVTPNLPEAAALLKLLEREGELGDDALGSLEGAADAARRLSAFGPAWVLVKGGHADAEAPKSESEGKREAVDVLYESSTGNVTYLRAPRVDTAVAHGTGCTLASSIACGLARGMTVSRAVDAAKRYVTGALASSAPTRLGRGPQHPMCHGYSTSACDWGRGDGLRVQGPADYGLYVVTDPRLVPSSEMRSRVAAAVRGGATVVQVRDKSAGPAALLESSLEALRGAGDGSPSSPSAVRVVVNDRADVALGAPGVSGAHVGQGDLPAAAARRVLGHARVLGVSVRTPEQALEAFNEGADYVGAGAVFPTGTKDDAEVIGLEGLAEIARAVPAGFPVVAIGGVNAGNAAEAIRAGASGVAVVSAVFGKGDSSVEDVERAAREIRAAVDGALAERR